MGLQKRRQTKRKVGPDKIVYVDRCLTRPSNGVGSQSEKMYPKQSPFPQRPKIPKGPRKFLRYREQQS